MELLIGALLALLFLPFLVFGALLIWLFLYSPLLLFLLARGRVSKSVLAAWTIPVEIVTRPMTGFVQRLRSLTLHFSLSIQHDLHTRFVVPSFAFFCLHPLIYAADDKPAHPLCAVVV